MVLHLLPPDAAMRPLWRELSRYPPRLVSPAAGCTRTALFTMETLMWKIWLSSAWVKNPERYQRLIRTIVVSSTDLNPQRTA